MVRVCSIAICLCVVSSACFADSPRGWRGDGSGKFASKNPPLKWSSTKNILWRTPMPAKSNSQPVIAGNRVFTLAELNTLICLDKTSGKILWQRTNSYRDLLGETRWTEVADQLKQAAVFKDLRTRLKSARADFLKRLKTAKTAEQKARLKKNLDSVESQLAVCEKELEKLPLAAKWSTFPTHQGKNGYTTASPVTDGRHVWAVFGNAVVCCYDLKGSRKWIKRMTDKPHHMFGHSASPLLVGNRLVINIEDTVALDAATGKELWRTGWGQGWGSAIHVKSADGVDLALIANGRFVRLSDGKVVGRGVNLSDSSPVFHDGVVYSIQNRGGAVKPGKIVDSKLQVARLWETNPPGARYFSSPVYHDGLLYTMSSRHIFSAIDARTGKVVYRRRLNIGGGTGYPSIAFAGGYLYASGDNGTTVVISAGRDYKEAGRNKLDGFISTPIFDGDRMYLRTFKYLYCIGSK